MRKRFPMLEMSRQTYQRELFASLSHSFVFLSQGTSNNGVENAGSFGAISSGTILSVVAQKPGQHSDIKKKPLLSVDPDPIISPKSYNPKIKVL